MPYSQAATTYGGDAAAPLSSDLIKSFQSLLNGGGQPSAASRTAQADPTGQTGGIMGVLNDVLSAGGGSQGSALSQLIQQKQTSDVASLRERFTGTGTSGGTPAAVAESKYRAQAAPEAATAIGNLQNSIIGPLLQMITGVAQKGISQQETTNVVQPNPWLQLLQGLSGGAQGAGSLIKALNLGGGAKAAALV